MLRAKKNNEGLEHCTQHPVKLYTVQFNILQKNIKVRDQSEEEQINWRKI